jgi:ribulose-5-phosphate 4-epimerase/fuculose-1-phosphate aldolase
VNLQPPLAPDDAEPRFDDSFESRLHRRARLVLAYRLFGSMGWGEQGDGHISARDPERTDCFWLLRYGVPFGDATSSDLVLVGPDGSIVEGEGGINVSAYRIHGPIHAARPDVVCVAHTHTPYGTPWSACAEPFSMICQEALAFHGCHSVFDDGEVDVQSVDGGKRIAASLDEGRLSILRNHGLLTVGSNVDEAVGWYLMAERVAEVHCKAPDPKPIGDDDAHRCATTIADPATAWHAFNWAIRARGL